MVDAMASVWEKMVPSSKLVAWIERKNQVAI